MNNLPTSNAYPKARLDLIDLRQELARVVELQLQRPLDQEILDQVETLERALESVQDGIFP